MKKIFLIIVLSIPFFSCEESKNLPAPYDCVIPPLVKSSTCINTSQIGNSDECIESYDPVCGCDGITYGNYCLADSSGVASYVAGECCD